MSFQQLSVVPEEAQDARKRQSEEASRIEAALQAGSAWSQPQPQQHPVDNGFSIKFAKDSVFSPVDTAYGQRAKQEDAPDEHEQSFLATFARTIDVPADAWVEHKKWWKHSLRDAAAQGLLKPEPRR